MNKYIKSVIQLIIFLSIGLGIMYYLYTKNEEAYQSYCQTNNIPSENCSLAEKLKSDFQSINYFWISMILVGFGMTNFSRAKRWEIILKALDYKASLINLYGTVNVAYLANLGLPRIGEFVRAAMLSKYENLPFDKIFGSVVVDRIADMISFLLLILLAFVLDTSAFNTFFSEYASFPHIGFNIYFLLIIFLSGFILWKFRQKLLQMNLVNRVIVFLNGIWTGIMSIRNLKERRKFLFHTLLIWLWYYLMFVFACKAFPATAQLGIIPMLVVYVFGSFGVFLPSPGGMGTYHLMVIIGMGLYGLHETESFSFANIAFFSAQFLALIVFGIISLIVLSLYNQEKNKLPDSSKT